MSAGVRFAWASEYHKRRFRVVVALPLLGFVVSPKARPAPSKKYKTPLQFSFLMPTLEETLGVNGIHSSEVTARR